MKIFSPVVSLSSGKAAAIVAFSLIGLNAFGVQPGPATAAGAAVAGAQAAALPPVAPEEDILDIRGPIHIAAPVSWAPWTVGALAAAGLGLGGWALLRRPRRRLPYEIALADLETLRAMMQPENARVFSLAVSEIVRCFVEECLPLRAAHRTTNEFLHDLVKVPDCVPAAQREVLEVFLTHCDLAKFARWSLSVPQMEAMLASASAFVIAIGKSAARAPSPRVSTDRIHAEQPAPPVAAREAACASQNLHTA